MHLSSTLPIWWAVAFSLVTGMGESRAEPGGLFAALINRQALGADRECAAAALFDEDVLADNVRHIHHSANALPAAASFELLRNWVLPSDSHDSIRLTASFVATHEATLSVTGINLVSPAVVLLDVAQKTGRLEELIAAIQQCQVTTEQQQRSKLALLTLAKIRQRDLPAALSFLGELSDRHRKQVFAGLADRWPETIVAEEAIHHSELREAAEELLQRMLQDQVRQGKFNGPDPWDRFIFALAGIVKNKGWIQQPLALRDWLPVSATDFGRNGLGNPRSTWTRNGFTVQAVSHHFDDYLYYRIPLVGNYQVECDLSGFDYRDAQLLVAGTWLGLEFNHEKLQVGNIREQRPSLVMEKRLSEIGDWMRMRVVVQDDKRTAFINGRLVHEELLSVHHEPWLALRISFYSSGGVRNVCVTGHPLIPATLDLSVDPQLSGWTSYYGGEIGVSNRSDWRQELDGSGNGIIIGQFEETYVGTAKECLLQYQRPLAEDGVIEYEFFFEPRRVCAHPALGRTVFLLTQDGIRLHWITDGKFDQSGADPLNERANQFSRSPSQPDEAHTISNILKPNAWNHLKLGLQSEMVTLSINQQIVCQTQIAEGEDRTFGLFHDSGATEARVRNVRWTGAWPKTLPPIAEQELRDKTPDELDQRLPELRQVFKYDFVKQGLSKSQFEIQDQGADKYVTAQTDGVHVDAEMTGPGYKRVCITPYLVIEGDFDITADFSDLQCTPTRHGQCNALIQVAFTDAEISHQSISMTQIADPGRPLRRVVEHQFLQLKPFHMGFLDRRSEEIASGRMRLARRGNKAYSLLATEDFGLYRLIHVESVVTAPTRLDGVRLMTGMNSSIDDVSKVSVVWKSITVQAEGLTGAAMSD